MLLHFVCGRGLMVNDQTKAAGTNVLESIKDSLQIDKISEHVRQSKDSLLDVGLYACIGFLVGYLLKRYSTFIMFLVLFTAGIIALQQVDMLFISVNWDKVYELVGIQPVLVTSEGMAAIVWDWIQLNVLIVASFIVGFLIGLRIG